MLGNFFNGLLKIVFTFCRRHSTPARLEKLSTTYELHEATLGQILRCALSLVGSISFLTVIN